MAAGEAMRKRTGGGSGPGPGSREIPDKLYFRIGEVARLCEVPAYVLRFWESEFPQLKPNKGGTGQRLYRRRDVEMALRIKNLLYDEGYTIAGARQAFKMELRLGREAGEAESGTTVDVSHLQQLQRDLKELHAMLSRPAAAARPAASVQSIRPERPSPVARVLPAPTPFPGPRRLSLFDDEG